MKLVLPFAFTFISYITAFSQDFMGQWKGEFRDKSVSGGDWGGDKCEYIIELESLKNNKVKGYSYTYFSENGKKYYTICSLEGRYDPAQKFVEIRETGRTKTNVPSNIRNCFQVHRLTYFKKGNEEQLSGDWIPAPGQEADCGFGQTSLVRRTLEKGGMANNVNAQNKKANSAVLKPAVPQSANNSSIAVAAGNGKPRNQKVSDVPAGTQHQPLNKTETETKLIESTPVTLNNPDKAPESPAFEKRTASVVRTIEIEKKTFRIDIFDNGEIDGDSISLFFNDELIVSNKKLTEKPITLFLTLKDDIQANDLEMYAENLGSIPPNTAVMTVTDGTKRYDLRVTSDLKKNGVIRFVQRKQSY